YLLNHREEFSLWKSKSEDFICGLSSWKGINKICSRGAASERLEISAGEAVTIDLGRLLSEIFRQIGMPLLLEDLVDLAADLTGIKDEVCEPESVDEPVQSTIAEKIDQQRYLQRLWAKICELPLRQRAALLLNLRDEYGLALLVCI